MTGPGTTGPGMTGPGMTGADGPVRPLDGIRVVDFTRQMSGPYATLVLADYGAEVIKVEALPDGDGSRRIGTAFVGDESALFLMWNRGKQSVAVDLRSAEGRAAVRRLADTADVVVENYRPGVADRIGIGYQELRATNPRLVYASVSAFGPTGPLADRPGTDPIVQAASGIMSVTGEPGGEPLLVGVPIADFTAAMICVQGVLLGLAARERTGCGQKVDISMLYGLMSALTTRLASYWTDGNNPAPSGNAHSVVVPYQVFPTSDRDIVAGVWGDAGWPSFCRAIGREDLADDDDYATNQLRVRHRAKLTDTLREVFRSRSAEHWETACAREGVLFARVNTFADVFDHPQVREAGIVTTVDHPRLGALPALGPVIGLSETPGAVGAPPPALGQHTLAVLRSLGFPQETIQAWHRDGIVHVAGPPDAER